MTNEEVSRLRKPISMWPILREACLLSWNHRQHFARLLIIPVTLMTLISVAESYWLESKDTSSIALIGFLQVLPDFLIFTFFAVSCHRSILIGEHSVSRFGVPGWSMRETRFYLWILGIYTLGFFFLILFSAVLGVIPVAIGRSMGETWDNIMAVMKHPAFFYSSMALLSVPFAYVVGRLSLVLPAVAVDLRPSFTSGWAQSEGNGWRVTILVGGIPILFMILQALFSVLVGWLTGTNDTQTLREMGIFFSIINSGFCALLQYVLATVEVAILSLTFKELSGWQQNVAFSTQA